MGIAILVGYKQRSTYQIKAVGLVKLLAHDAIGHFNVGVSKERKGGLAGREGSVYVKALLVIRGLRGRHLLVITRKQNQKSVLHIPCNDPTSPYSLPTSGLWFIDFVTVSRNFQGSEQQNGCEDEIGGQFAALYELESNVI